MPAREYSDTELLELLLDLDEDEDTDITLWEAEFLNSILAWKGRYTQGQRDKIKEILERYERL